ncbi:kelch motif-containing protein, partial [bacterium]|nr:kelch motif-containing protein [bacterium]
HHIQSLAIIQNKVDTKSIINRHFEDESIITSKIRDQVIENDHLVDAIIQSIHVVDGSLKSADVKEKSLPGTKFTSTSVESSNILSGNILTTHIADFSISGDSFVNNSIESAKLSTGFLNKDLLEAFTLSSDQVKANTITAAMLDSHFFLGGDIIENNAFDRNAITTGAIHPYHLLDSLDISKISSVSGEKFQDYAINTSQIKNQSATGTQILTATIGAVDFNIIYKAENFINKVSQDSSASLTWQTSIDDIETVQMSLNASKDKFSFTSQTALYLAATDTGEIEKEVFDVASRFSARKGHKVLTLGSKVIIIGGRDNSDIYLQDVWSSNDGIIFKRLTSAAAFGNLAYFGAAVFGGQIYVACGESSTGIYTNSIYKSADGGATWTFVAAPSTISNRRLISLSVYNGKVYIIGGQDSSGKLNDVYVSSDFISFSETDPINMSDTETVLLIHSDTTDGSTTFSDHSFRERTIIGNGGMQHSTAKPHTGFGNSSIYFDGTDDYLSIADHNDWDWNGEFTVDFWIFNTSNEDSNSGYMRLMAMGNNTANRFQLY